MAMGGRSWEARARGEAVAPPPPHAPPPPRRAPARPPGVPPQTPARVADLRRERVAQELRLAKDDLSKVRLDHSRLAAKRADDERLRLESEALEAEERMKEERTVKAAMRLQAFVRTVHVWRNVLPKAAEEHRQLRLIEVRAELKGSLMGLRHTMHGLQYLEPHQRAAATKIQAWWRGMLTLRIVSVLLVRRKIEEIHQLMELAAMNVQAHWRGRMARASCEEMRRHREEWMQRVARERELRLQRAAVRVQSFWRKSAAVREADKRRMARNKELLASEGEAAEARNMLRRMSVDFGGSCGPRHRSKGSGGKENLSSSRRTPRRKRDPVAASLRASYRSERAG